MIQYKNFLIKREQSRAGSRFAECEKSRLKAKLLMTLALLLTAATGAWAQTTFGVKEITADMVPDSWYGSGSIVTPEDLADMGINFVGITEAQARTWADYPTTGHVYLLHAYTTSFQSVDWNNGNPSESSSSTAYTRQDIYNLTDGVARVFVTVEPIVTWDATTKTATFTQPGSDVVLTPIYAKTAAFATTGTEPEVKTLLPEAAEGVIAGTDAPLIAEGTGIVATTTIGETLTAQGTVMYYVGTSAPTIGSDDWTEDVPTAKGYDDAATVTVWYYIQGADAPATVAATLDNTFNNSDISSLTVSVLSNKFDLALNPANANTIDATDASKGTVSVKVGTGDAEDKTGDITEGKLKAIKMGSEVKMTTAQGYKFRKVEVKKAKPVAKLTAAPEPWTVHFVGASLLQTPGTAEGGTLMYKVTKTNVTPETTEGFSIVIPVGVENGPSYKNYIWYYIKGDENHSDSEIFGPIEVSLSES